MKEKITATPQSFTTSTLTPVVVQDTPNVKIIFDGLQVDNHQELKKNIKGKLIIKKKSKKTDSFDDVNKFSRKDISNYDLVEIALDTENTFNLAKGLYYYYRMFSGKYTNPYDKVSYVHSDDNNQQLKAILESKENLSKLLKTLDTNTLNAALNIKNLEQVKEEIEKNLANADEQYWQQFFTQHSWALSQLFNAPLMIFNEARYVGGKSVSNKHGKITDFFYKNSITNNISLIEIKTPCSELFKKIEYRDDIPTISTDLVGGVSQLLEQKQKLYNEYSTLRTNAIDNDEEDFCALNIKSVLLVGTIKNLTIKEKRALEIYRNELKSIDIITFDELLAKVSTLIELLNS